MVQVVRKNYAGKVKTLQVHRILRVLCIMKARELGFLTVFSSDSEVITLSSHRAFINLSVCPTLLVENAHLRSLMLFGQSGSGLGVDVQASKGNKATLNLAPMCGHFKLLRVLALSRIKSSDGELPKKLGSLTHLRYLRIRSTNIRAFPKSIGNLRNLLTLDFRGGTSDNEINLPKVLWKLGRLRHLYLMNKNSSTIEDLKLDTIRNLKTLWGVKGGKWMVEGMRNLSATLKKLYIQGISSREQLEAVFTSPIVKTHDRLYALALDWYGFDLDSLDALHTKQSLQKLRLIGSMRTPDSQTPLKFPSELQKIELYYTQLEIPKTMAALGGLHSLKILRLCMNAFIGSEWTCSGDAFPKLEELKLSNLPKLEKWKMELGTMPYLKKLSIVSYILLKRVPEGMKFINTLQILKVENMPLTFCRRLRQIKEKNTSIGGEDVHIVENIPYVGIWNPYPSPL